MTQTTTIPKILSERIETLTLEIQRLEAERTRAKAALAAYVRSEDSPLPSSPSQRFAGMMPFDAIQIVLNENGGEMSRSELMDALVAGGATYGKKRGHHNLRISIEVNEKLGKLIVEGETIRLAQHEQAAAI